MGRLFILISMAALALTGTARADSLGELHARVKTDPVPEWVTSQMIGTPTDEGRANAHDGTYTLLFDTQIKVDDTSYEFFRRKSSLVLSEGGLEENGQFSLSFDPETEQLTIHHVTIWRDGEKIERLDALHLSVARQETDLTQGVADGTLTVFAEIPDVRVGDVVDWAASWDVATPSWPGLFSYDFNVEWSVPSAYDHTRILTPKDLPLSIQYRDNAPAPQQSIYNGMDERIWAMANSKGHRHYYNVPGDIVQYASVSVSTVPAWTDVASWGVALYQLNDALPSDIQAEIAALEGFSRDQKITWAIRRTQDDIRYFSDSVGLGAHVPRTPAVTFARGYGDCKDKSLLLVALLEAIGVEASVALTDIDEGESLPQAAPSPFAFDHAVVRIMTEEGPVYIDPTRRLQGGMFPHIRKAAYGYALPLIAGAELERMPIEDLSGPTIDVREHFNFTDASASGMTLNVTTVRKGLDADRFRNQLTTIPVASIERQYREYYQASYPGLESAGDLAISDERDLNRVTVTERYQLPAEAFTPDLLAAFPFEAEAVRFDFPTDLKQGRPFPVAIGHPNDARHTVVLDGIAHLVAQDQPLAKQVGPLYLNIQSAISNGTVILDHRIRTQMDRVRIEDIDAYRDAYAEFEKQLSFTYDLSGLLGQTEMADLFGTVTQYISGLSGGTSTASGETISVQIVPAGPGGSIRMVMVAVASLFLGIILGALFMVWRAPKRRSIA